MIQIAMNQVEKGFSIYPILKGVSFEIQDQERIGIVGRNGCGKTTLFKLFMGIETPDKGEVFIRKGATLGYVEQIPHYETEMTVKDVLQTAFEALNEMARELRTLEEQMSVLTDEALEKCLARYARLSEAFEGQGGYERENRLNRICTGLQFSDSFLAKSFSALSGGEKTTVLLGKVLIQNPDVLLLDEPTNHLDMKAMDWLEEYLSTYKGAVVMISHDRYFLDQVAQKVVEIDNGKAVVYHGNYSYYVKEKERLLLAEFEAYEDQQKKIKAMEKAIKRLRDWANRADNEDMYKKAACMQRRLDKMEKLDKPMTQKKMDLTFSEANRSGKEVIQIEGLRKSFGDKCVLNGADLRVQYQEHVALIGENGCGKSTLIKILLGEQEADDGLVQLGTRLKIAYLPQNVRFEDEELTVLETFKKDVVMTPTEARSTLAKFLFYGEQVFKKVKGLSGGEKSRLLLCKLLQEEVNLLILDEPTNHLDIESRENLEEALQSFGGTLLFISHDRFFINKLAKRVCEMSQGQIKNYIGNYNDYKEKKQQEVRKAQEGVNTSVVKQESKKLDHLKEKEKTKEEQPRKRNDGRIAYLEKQLQFYESRQQEIESQMEKAVLDYPKWQELEQKHKEVVGIYEGLIEEWLGLQ